MTSKIAAKYFESGEPRERLDLKIGQIEARRLVVMLNNQQHIFNSGNSDPPGSFSGSCLSFLVHTTYTIFCGLATAFSRIYASLKWGRCVMGDFLREVGSVCWVREKRK